MSKIIFFKLKKYYFNTFPNKNYCDANLEFIFGRDNNAASSIGLFRSVVSVVFVFQSVFHGEIHQNDIFFIFKKLFLRSAHQNNPKYIK